MGQAGEGHNCAHLLLVRTWVHGQTSPEGQLGNTIQLEVWKEGGPSSGEYSVLCLQAWVGHRGANCSLRMLGCLPGTSFRLGEPLAESPVLLQDQGPQENRRLGSIPDLCAGDPVRPHTPHCSNIW